VIIILELFILELFFLRVFFFRLIEPLGVVSPIFVCDAILVVLRAPFSDGSRQMFPSIFFHEERSHFSVKYLEMVVPAARSR